MYYPILYMMQGDTSALLGQAAGCSGVRHMECIAVRWGNVRHQAQEPHAAQNIAYMGNMRHWKWGHCTPWNISRMGVQWRSTVAAGLWSTIVANVTAYIHLRGMPQRSFNDENESDGKREACTR
ncbi:hypothetical protein EDD15DRAFT_2518493 [Pisolithus albus]|nr:hypothetical protein EDD15DRAFT_2518493 [Pisolithus albus]